MIISVLKLPFITYFWWAASYSLKASTFGWEEHPGTNSFVRKASVNSSLNLLPIVKAPIHAMLNSAMTPASKKEINKNEYSLCNHKIKKRIIPAGRKLFKKITPLFRITTLLYSTERSNSFDFIRLFRRFSLSLQGFLLFSFLGGS